MMVKRGSWLMVIVVLLVLDLKAQESGYPYDIVRYGFINYKENNLKFYGDSSYYEKLFNKLDRLVLEGVGNVNVVHMGGSHIQAGIWSGQIRERMQSFYPGLKGQQGFAFPYRLAQTNTPVNYWVEYTGKWEGCRNVEKKKKCDLGISGISVTTYDSTASFMLYKRENTDYLAYDFNKFKLFHSFPNPYEIIFDDSTVHYTREDFPEFGFSEFSFDEYQDTLKIKISKPDSIPGSFTLHGIIMENDDPGIVYNSFGINGASVPSFLRCNMLQEHLAYYYPDLVILSIGINDAYGRKFDPNYFERNYDTLINRIRQVAPDAAILLTTNNDSYLYKRYVNRNGEKVRKAMIDLAKRHHAAVWDMYTVMGGLNSIVTWQRYGLAKYDKIHFTREGYTIMGNLLFNAFLKAYDNHLERVQKQEPEKVFFK